MDPSSLIISSLIPYMFAQEFATISLPTEQSKDFEYSGELPQILIGAELTDSHFPYEVKIDTYKLAKFLALMGTPAKEIGKLHLNLRAIEPNTAGMYLSSRNEQPNHNTSNRNDIFINIYEFTGAYEELLKLAKGIIDSEKYVRPETFNNVNYFVNIYTKRLADYLANPRISAERRKAFSERLFREAAQRGLLRTLAHEAKHLRDAKVEPELWEKKKQEDFHIPLIAGTSGLLVPALTVATELLTKGSMNSLPIEVVIGLVSFIIGVSLTKQFVYSQASSIENSARAFAESLTSGNLHDWQIITFSPRDEAKELAFMNDIL